MSQPTIIPGIQAVASKPQDDAIRAAAANIAAGLAAPEVRDTLRKAGVYIGAEVVTKLQASAAGGTLTVKDADKLLAGQSLDIRYRAKAALHLAGLLK